MLILKAVFMSELKIQHWQQQRFHKTRRKKTVPPRLKARAPSLVLGDTFSWSLQGPEIFIVAVSSSSSSSSSSHHHHHHYYYLCHQHHHCHHHSHQNNAKSSASSSSSSTSSSKVPRSALWQEEDVALEVFDIRSVILCQRYQDIEDIKIAKISRYRGYQDIEDIKISRGLWHPMSGSLPKISRYVFRIQVQASEWGDIGDSGHFVTESRYERTQWTKGCDEYQYQTPLKCEYASQKIQDKYIFSPTLCSKFFCKEL